MESSTGTKVPVTKNVNSIILRDYFKGRRELENSIPKIPKSTYIILYVEMEKTGIEIE